MSTQSAYSWLGLTLTHRTIRTGADLSPQWALVRVRRALEDHRGEASGRPSDGRLNFDDSVSSISLTGAVLPSTVSGQVRAESVPDGIAVIATATLTSLIAGLVMSLVASAVLFIWRRIPFTPGYWLWICLLASAGAWHLRQVARVLRMVTTAGTSL